MSVHYKQPILLIEFEENKSFSLQVRPLRASSAAPVETDGSPVVPARTSR